MPGGACLRAINHRAGPAKQAKGHTAEQVGPGGSVTGPAAAKPRPVKPGRTGAAAASSQLSLTQRAGTCRPQPEWAGAESAAACKRGDQCSSAHRPATLGHRPEPAGAKRAGAEPAGTCG